MDASTHTRLLDGNDVALMRAMLNLFGDAFADRMHYGSAQPDDAYLARLLGSENFVAVAAFAGQQLVGGLAGYALPKFEQPRTEFYIYDLAVDEAHRRQGFATAMIAALQQLATQRGYCGIFVQADHGDDPAIALYEKLGSRAEVLHFDIPPLPDKAY